MMVMPSRRSGFASFAASRFVADFVVADGYKVGC